MEAFSSSFWVTLTVSDICGLVLAPHTHLKGLSSVVMWSFAQTYKVLICIPRPYPNIHLLTHCSGGTEVILGRRDGKLRIGHIVSFWLSPPDVPSLFRNSPDNFCPWLTLENILWTPSLWTFILLCFKTLTSSFPECRYCVLTCLRFP